MRVGCAARYGSSQRTALRHQPFTTGSFEVSHRLGDEPSCVWLDQRESLSNNKARLPVASAAATLRRSAKRLPLSPSARSADASHSLPSRPASAVTHNRNRPDIPLHLNQPVLRYLAHLLSCHSWREDLSAVAHKWR
ncbi:hypothetical protein BLNAU_20319 [Blattamonas nauphoetae]|uniref:Uncharacterized protein n=1 Tax=Blattamonas nauphoetae TaxID=2049346 RepID=A0ABQ9X2F0_9EUKA|nr:hypothetical protein BLNAU_20319 [Blattamonas nauphoetae]